MREVLIIFTYKYILSSSTLNLQDFVFKSLVSTCFPGCDIPAWFNHQAYGSVLNVEFPWYWNEGQLNGVVSFKDYKDQNNGLQVICTCEFTNVSLSRESFIIGGWSTPGDEPHTIESDHVFIGYTLHLFLLLISRHCRFMYLHIPLPLSR